MYTHNRMKSNTQQLYTEKSCDGFTYPEGWRSNGGLDVKILWKI